MAISDLYQADVRLDINGEEVVNVFHFQQTSVSGSGTDLALRILNQWIDANWETLVSLAVSFIEIAVRNLFNPDEQVVYPVGTTGDVAGDYLPPHDAMRLTLNTDLKSIRAGRKAIAGLSEASQDGGVFGAATVAAWQAFIDDTLTEPLIGPSSEPRYYYVIVKRIPYTTGSGSTAYRLPESLGEAIFATVDEGTASAYVRTQGSRDFLE